MAQELGLVVVPETIFSHEELGPFVREVQERAPHYIQIMCGCTSKTHGDIVGIFKISDDGTISATCNCCKKRMNQYIVSHSTIHMYSLTCSKGKQRGFEFPIEFVKHASGTTNVSNWKTRVWVQHFNGDKIKLGKTCLLKYYKGDQYQRPHNVFHRDEFLRCSSCNKKRRFQLRSPEVFSYYHDAEGRENRSCADMIPGKWKCSDLEERTARNSRGCRKNMNCTGCKYCVCFGCDLCRIVDCGCRACIDFYANASV